MPDKAWAVQVDGRWFQVQDLPAGVLAGIAKKHDQTWIDVMVAPARDAGVAQALINAVCDQAGLAHPEGLSGRQLITRFELVDDDKPTEFTDGIPPEGADR